MSIKDGILDLPIKKYWFNEIKSGRKTHEYRNSATWASRLKGEKANKYKYIRFRQGELTKSNDTNRVLYGEILSVKIIDGKDTDLKINHKVYDIEFKLLKQAPNSITATKLIK